MESVKNFLLTKNNAGELNIERLGVVGVEMGATIAVNWAALDWSWPVLATGKQGQDVKALVLVSPEWSFKGVRISEAIVQPSVQQRTGVLDHHGPPQLEVCGRRKRLNRALARYHPEPARRSREADAVLADAPHEPAGNAVDERKDASTCEQMIVEFVELRLLKPDFAWRDRQAPL